MAYELIYTSAEQGLKPRSHGFCTVAMTRGVSPNLVERLENMSGYRAHYAAHDPNASKNPVNYSYYRMKIGGRTYAILSRICFAGFDYTGRSNKLAHHLVLDDAEQSVAGPTQIALQTGSFLTEWSGAPREIPSPRKLSEGQRATVPAATWQAVAGDAGWAGAVAEHSIKPDSGPVVLVVPPDMPSDRVLWLLDEAMALVPPDRRWDMTFSTYLTDLPMGTTCTWRCIIAGSPEVEKVRRTKSALVLDLTGPLGRAPEGELAKCARTGMDPYAAQAEPVTSAATDWDTLPLRQERRSRASSAAGAVPSEPKPQSLVFNPFGQPELEGPIAVAPRKTSIAAQPVAAPAARRNTWLPLGLASAAVVLLAAGVVFFLVQQRKKGQLLLNPAAPPATTLPSSPGSPLSKLTARELVDKLLGSGANPVGRDTEFRPAEWVNKTFVFGNQDIANSMTNAKVTWNRSTGNEQLLEEQGSLTVHGVRSEAGTKIRVSLTVQVDSSVDTGSFTIVVPDQKPLIRQGNLNEIAKKTHPANQAIEFNAEDWVDPETNDGPGDNLYFNWSTSLDSVKNVSDPVLRIDPQHIPPSGDIKVQLRVSDRGNPDWTKIPPKDLLIRIDRPRASATTPPVVTTKPVATVQPATKPVTVGKLTSRGFIVLGCDRNGTPRIPTASGIRVGAIIQPKSFPPELIKLWDLINDVEGGNPNAIGIYEAYEEVQPGSGEGGRWKNSDGAGPSYRPKVAAEGLGRPRVSVILDDKATFAKHTLYRLDPEVFPTEGFLVYQDIDKLTGRGWLSVDFSTDSSMAARSWLAFLAWEAEVTVSGSLYRFRVWGPEDALPRVTERRSVEESVKAALRNAKTDLEDAQNNEDHRRNVNELKRLEERGKKSALNQAERKQKDVLQEQVDNYISDEIEPRKKKVKECQSDLDTATAALKDAESRVTKAKNLLEDIVKKAK